MTSRIRTVACKKQNIVAIHSVKNGDDGDNNEEEDDGTGNNNIVIGVRYSTGSSNLNSENNRHRSDNSIGIKNNNKINSNSNNSKIHK